MKSFSDQIRDAIDASCVTRYALAEQAEIADSALSRFMSGKQGMSSATLDRIADALGLQVRVGVQMFRKSRKPGRPKKEEPKMKQPNRLTSSEWKRLAQNAAKDAHKKNFPSRRGLYLVEGAGIVYYDNNPFKLPREADRREELISELRDFLKRSTMKEMACAYYPPSGESKDYTFAMVIQAEPRLLNAVHNVFLDIVNGFENGWHQGIDLGHPADGDTRRYTIPWSALGGSETGDPSTIAEKFGSRSLRTRILGSIERRSDGCWIWTGAKVWAPHRRHKAYGYLRIRGRTTTVRQLAYEQFGKTPPLEDYALDSTCGNSLCVNPDHLVRSSRRKSKGPPRQATEKK